MNDSHRSPAVSSGGNPFFETWNTPFGAPPFDPISPEHFVPAFDRAFAEHEAEIAAIAGNPQPPTFDNTIVALEDAGRSLQRVEDVFHQLVGADSNDALLAMEREHVATQCRALEQGPHERGAVQARRCAVTRKRETLGLDREQARVLERHHTMFRRQGAALDADKKRSALAEIVERLAALGTAFSQNVLSDEQTYALELDGDGDLAGLPDFVRAAARAAAEERGLAGKHVITLQRSSVEPFLQFSARRDLREKVFRAWQARGDKNDKTDNKAIIAETVRLRAERARLLGYPDFAHYRLDDAMAKTPEAVRALLDKVWAPARVRALADRDAMQELIAQEGGNFRLAPWDWRYYAEKLRKIRCDIEEAAVKPYMQLDRSIEAAFHTAQPPVRADVSSRRRAGLASRCAGLGGAGADGSHVGLFFGDYFARPSKRRRRLDGDVARPGEARRRRPPAGAERDEFQQGRSDAAVVRRRPHAVP